MNRHIGRRRNYTKENENYYLTNAREENSEPNFQRHNFSFFFKKKTGQNRNVTDGLFLAKIKVKSGVENTRTKESRI